MMSMSFEYKSGQDDIELTVARSIPAAATKRRLAEGECENSDPGAAHGEWPCVCAPVLTGRLMVALAQKLQNAPSIPSAHSLRNVAEDMC